MEFLSTAKREQPLSSYSTFGIGGPARYLLEVFTKEELCAAVKEAYQNGIPFILIGKGSNCLFDDKGFDGLVIINKIAYVTLKDAEFEVGAGYSFSLLGVQTARKGWSGLEFASGIPASVGGAIYMNAGANGGETKDCLTEVCYLHPQGEMEIFLRDQIEFRYRYSSFQNMRGAIVSAKFTLVKQEGAREKQLGIVHYRTHTQPYGDKSAGCVFRNPTGHAAGALIEKCGLKGIALGGAQVSTLHANFIINKSQATAEDVVQLAQHVAHTVKEKEGIELEMEIRRIPYRLDDVIHVSR
jgi:UDP-N-acetylmuramate dehydrogenase